MTMEFVKLSDGNQLPVLGLGVWQVPDGPTCERAVRWALELGYRHIDTAQAYGNEASVGKALRESGVPRDEVFITTKFYPGRKDPVAEAEKSLGRLGVDQVTAAGSVTPAVNQIQFSAVEYRRGLVEACRRHGIVPEAYPRHQPRSREHLVAIVSPAPTLAHAALHRPCHVV
jgi:diketogulonate reductase-like aldo/keto reductase